MGATTNEMVRVLKTAIEVEKNGYETFKKLADKTADAEGKRMFGQLAKDEVEHRELLEKQLAHLEAGGSVKSVVIPKSEVESLIPAIREKQKRIKGEAGLGAVDALTTALDLERKAGNFFREKAAELASQELKAMFMRLAEWEDSHYDLIQAELDSINNTGMWFGLPEFQMDGLY